MVFHVPTGTHLKQWIYLPVQWPSDQISVVGWDHERPGESYQRQHGRNGNQGEIDWWNVDYLKELSHHILVSEAGTLKIRIFVEYWGKKLYTSIQTSYFEFDVYIFLVIHVLRNMIRKLSFYIYKSMFLIFGDKINLSDTLIQFLKRYHMTVPVLDNWEPYNFVEYLVHTKSMWL